MKNIYLVLALIVSSCCAQQVTTVDAKSNFNGVKQPYFQKWVGGAPGSGSGSTLYFPSSILTGEEFVAIYFAGNKSENYSYTADDRMQIVVRFLNGDQVNRDTVMDIDAKKEYANKITEKPKLPVELKPNQALIAVKGTKKDELKYILIDNINEETMMAFPSMPSK